MTAERYSFKTFKSFTGVKFIKGVVVDNAKVLKTDVMATNGVIHVIDTVLMPKMNDRKMD